MTNTTLMKANELKFDLATNYMKAIENSLGKKEALSFLSSVVFAIQKTPKLLDCKRETLITAIMQAVELKLSIGPSGEFYILPYKDEAQGQLGYKGIVTLLYRAGVQSIRGEIVYKNDEFKNENGIIKHNIDIFKSSKDRGEAIGAYIIAKVNGEEISKAMNKYDILKFMQFSKSKGSPYTPWLEKNDPELNMWKKTVLKQLAKMLPQNEVFAKAMEIDNKDSIVSDEKINEMSPDDVISKSLEGFGEGKEGENKDIS